jgi:hypothetical protein
MQVATDRESDRAMIVRSAGRASIDQTPADILPSAVAANAPGRLAQVLVMPVYFMGSRFLVGWPAWSVHCPR